MLFFLAPSVTLIFSLLGWSVIPFGEGLAIADLEQGLLLTLALSSLGVYGILFAGWSSNSKYALIGSLRSSAAMVSYELILSTVILVVLFLTGTFNYTNIVESQSAIWLIVPTLPLFLMYFISVLAETSRTPFDLQEDESALVSGFFVEYSSVPFVFFFLAEYSSIVLFSTLTSIFFLGGYLISPELFVNYTFINLQAISLGLKTSLICFLFIWVRASLPRVRYDQLVELCWLNLLPIAVAILILIPSILIAFDIAK